jgi:transposase InsO family protein
MCNISKVSKSGYYKWLKRKQKLKQEQDLLLIYAIFLLKNKKAGFRTIKMNLKRYLGITMNHKKIIKLMKILNIQGRIRKANPYKKKMLEIQEKRIVENIVDGNFKNRNPFEVLSCDITYLKYHNQFAYLSTMIDVKTNEVISYKLSKNLNVEFVIETIKNGLSNVPKEKMNNLIIHSDRGIQYSCKTTRTLLNEYKITQSMSKSGTPLDNAVIESFFGHLKDEVDYKKCKTFSELSLLIDNYMYNYNYNRPQWTKQKMTPIEYRNYLLAS